MSHTLALIGPFGWTEVIILAVLGLLVFGKRLPEVGRSLGKGIVEFKKGLSGIEDEVNNAGADTAATPRHTKDVADRADPAQLDAPADPDAVDTQQQARTEARTDKAAGDG